jgi:hypothetical protein
VKSSGDNVRKACKLSLAICIVLVLVLIPAPERVHAQWPPFRFHLTPSYDNGKITYRIEFYSRVDWTMTHVTFKIPLPVGTRFLEASAQQTTSVDFDGAEVTFFTSDLYRPIRTASFVVEVADPKMTVFTAHAWIAWQGDHPGDYLTEDVSIDITEQPLNWEVPSTSSLELEARATVADDVIIYAIYPRRVGWSRMWDLKVNVAVPEGTTFLSAEAPPPFVASFDGREVSFSSLELERYAQVGPLSFRVSTEGVAAPFVVTHAWAVWKNVGRGVAEEQARTGDIVVQPHASQWVASDMIGDVPFSNYDLTSIALQEDGPALKIIFYVVGDLGPVGEPLEYSLYIDGDCRTDTGLWRSYRGVEFRVRYRHGKGKADISFWDEEKRRWIYSGPIEMNSPVGGMVVLWVPYDSLEDGRQFCWVGEARNTTSAFSSNPPTEMVPNGTDLRLAQYEAVVTATATEAETSAVELSPTTSDIGDVRRDLPRWNAPNVPIPVPSVTPSVTDISGKLAVPLNNDWALYDVHIFSLPGGEEIAKISNARQPNFRFDGQKMLINREGGGVENVFEYNFADGTERQVSDAPRDSHPFYNPSGTRVVYGNPELTPHVHGYRICVQCSLLPPYQETEPRCQDITKLGMLVSAGLRDEIWGYNPVWTVNDMIAYRGCNSWDRFTSCGIYIVSSTSTRGFSDGFIPRQLTQDTSDIPSDTKGNLIAFTSHREGNWESYVMGLDGTGVKNLSNDPNSNDGLPTISPDGNWVAFVSDRSSRWAVWVVPVVGGPAQKLFDLPGNHPWGDGDRAWTNERISWGP